MTPDYATVDEVRARLRLVPTDVDDDRLARCTDAANALVDNWLDRHDDPTDPAARWPPLAPPYPAPVVEAACGVATRIYRFKDVDVDVANTWGDVAPLRVPRDPLAGYVDLLAPYRPGRSWCPA